MRSGACLTGTEVGCNDDDDILVTSYLSLPLAAGTYYVFVDGYDGSEEGEYYLDVTIVP